MYDQVLIPTDGSTASEGATDHAIDLARQYDATLHALYVVDAGTYSSLEVAAEVVSEELHAQGDDAVGAIAERAVAAGVTTETAVETGIVHRTIIEYVDAKDIDLVVMGTHGRTGVGRFLLGSVAEKVIRTADAPVLTVRSNVVGTDEADDADDAEA